MTQSLTTHRGLTVLAESATGAGGEAISENFTELANRTGPVYSGSLAPTVDDDEVGSAGHGSFHPWSLWHQTTTGGTWICRDASAGAAEWVRLDTSSAFSGLSDTPADYSGQAGKLVRVNTIENALEFIDAGGSTDAKVGVDASATPGYLGATPDDGVLRLAPDDSAHSRNPLGYSDAGDHIALDIPGVRQSSDEDDRLIFKKFLQLCPRTDAPTSSYADASVCTPYIGGTLWCHKTSNNYAGELRTFTAWPGLAALVQCSPMSNVGPLHVKFGYFDVPVGQTSHTILWRDTEIADVGKSFDSNVVVCLISPTWATSFWVGDLNTSQGTFHFGTAPGYGTSNRVYWVALSRGILE